MAAAAATTTTTTTTSSSFFHPFPSTYHQHPTSLFFPTRRLLFITHAKRNPTTPTPTPTPTTSKSTSKGKSNNKIHEQRHDIFEEEDEQVEEVEEEMPWIQDKALDLVQFTGTVTQAIPGPRIGPTSVPWALAVPIAYVGVSFVLAFVRTFRNFTSQRAQKKRMVGKNAVLLRSIDELFENGKQAVTHSSLTGLMHKTGFSMEDILRKYIRYTLNEKPFSPVVVVDLIHLRKESMLEDAQVAEVLNEVSRRIVREKGPVVMDLSGFTEKGFKRKLAVQALFGKILYLAELPEFCTSDSSLIIKEIFGVTDEDADALRIQTLSEVDDFESAMKMAGDSETEDADEDSSSAS